MRHDTHPTDADLLLALDGELDRARTGVIEQHLQGCWRCRTRRDELQRAIAEFMPLHELQSPAIPPGDGPAAKLRASMASIGVDGPQRSPRRYAVPAMVGGVAIAAAAFMLTWFAGQRVSAGPLPDSRLTPGATRLISREQICAVPLEADDRGVPAHLAQQVFAQYRISSPKPRMYEVDYLISPALGGAEDVRNLWPQPYADGVWNSRVKDALEDHLRRMVCDGRIELATAQQEIARDWIAAYRKYFGAQRPIAAHALFVKDRPWE